MNAEGRELKEDFLGTAHAGARRKTEVETRGTLVLAGDLGPPAMGGAVVLVAKDGIGHAQSNIDPVGNVTGVTVPPVNFGSDETTKLKGSLQHSLGDDQFPSFHHYAARDIGSSHIEFAFAPAIGASQQ
ncbi:hypothetical protein CQ12_16760 [Bradyrhizobium jicamae]|uniref:Uncharacterized protein n=2 Tax=Bradyrhizobium jicamae TaxID=280332 RepID=A0A0R3LH10_9BRAD|nr:hypothetical protein CQ12_16760 [Bradyrhizobium jicamae]